MGKPRHKHPLEDNPFVEGFLEWVDSPEGLSSSEISDALWEPMEDGQLEARQRKIIWPDGEGLSIDQSVERIHKLYPKFPSQQILSFLISWIEQYAPATLLREATKGPRSAHRGMA